MIEYDIHSETMERRREDMQRQVSCALLSLIRYHSERLWCASWMEGIEYTLWHAAHKQDEYRNLLVLAELCQQWWEWSDEQGGPAPVALDDWVAARTREVL